MLRMAGWLSGVWKNGNARQSVLPETIEIEIDGIAPFLRMIDQRSSALGRDCISRSPARALSKAHHCEAVSRIELIISWHMDALQAHEPETVDQARRQLQRQLEPRAERDVILHYDHRDIPFEACAPKPKVTREARDFAGCKFLATRPHGAGRIIVRECEVFSGGGVNSLREGEIEAKSLQQNSHPGAAFHRAFEIDDGDFHCDRALSLDGLFFDYSCPPSFQAARLLCAAATSGADGARPAGTGAGRRMPGWRPAGNRRLAGGRIAPGNPC
jgi:hypothetical protein